MFPLSKRQFLQLSGLSIASRFSKLRAEPSARREKVILVTFGGGVRSSETFSPEGLRNIPRLVELQPQGYFFKNCINSGVLSHFNSTGSILTGNWQRVDDFGSQPPGSLTIFEAYRKQRKARPQDAWVIATNKSFAQIGASADSSYGPDFGANVVLPKQLLLDSVEAVVRNKKNESIADRDAVYRRLEGILSEGYEGVGWTISKAGRQLDKQMRATLTRGLAEFINGPEAPTSGDELTFFIAREVMREFAPNLMLVNFWDMDVAHWGSYSLYLQAITKTDRLTGMLWDEVQSNSHYKDKTTLLILPELGRDGDINSANGFSNHRSGDASCRNVWMLALGGGIAKGETDRRVEHIDAAATALSLLGVQPPGFAGVPIKELLI